MNLLDYFGKFHPLAVHLPLGILVVFICIGLFVPRKTQVASLPVLKLILLVSAITATLSAISGYLLSLSNSYDTSVLSFHKWAGISLALLNWLIYFKIENLLRGSIRTYNVTLITTVIAFTLAGHAGGSLTHGSGYLNPPPINQWLAPSLQNTNTITLNTTAFEATTMIFNDKCVVCHGKNKQKGDLRLDTKEGILKGGENGKAISENTSNSLLMQRIHLPLDDEDHMPPKDKKQLTAAEIRFLSWWIDNGTDFDLTLNELKLPDSLHDILSKDEIELTDNTVPTEMVDRADNELLEKIRALGVILMYLDDESNYLKASFTNVTPEKLEQAIEELTKLKRQLVWLNMDYQEPDATAWMKLEKLTNLRKFSARNTNLSDNSLIILQKMPELVHLNLVGTSISGKGIMAISPNKNLTSVYLYRTQVTESEIESIRKVFPQAKLDLGNYNVPVLESDTTFLPQ